jgi:hypothetical protein
LVRYVQWKSDMSDGTVVSGLNIMVNPYNHYAMALLVINLCAHELTSPRRLIPTSAIENTNKNREEAIKIVDK